MKISQSILLHCILVIAPTFALGQAGIDRTKACVPIKNDTERLKCFDLSFVEEKVEKKSLGNWNVQVSESHLDKSKSVSIGLFSTESHIASRAFGNKNDQALLVIKCEENKTELLINFDYLVSLGSRSGVIVQYRIGKNSPVKARWSRSQNGKAFGTWDGPTTIPIIRKLMSSEDFFIRSESDLSGTTETLFKLDGLSEAIKPVQEACKWPKVS